MLQAVKRETTASRAAAKRLVLPDVADSIHSPATRTASRVRHLQIVAHESSMELREQWGCSINFDELKKKITRAKTALSGAMASYEKYAPISSVLINEESSSLSERLLTQVRRAVQISDETIALDLPRTAFVSMRFKERYIQRLRVPLGESCVIAEHLLAWLELHGAEPGSDLAQQARKRKKRRPPLAF
jgi:hypothetical protein